MLTLEKKIIKKFSKCLPGTGTGSLQKNFNLHTRTVAGTEAAGFFSLRLQQKRAVPVPHHWPRHGQNNSKSEWGIGPRRFTSI